MTFDPPKASDILWSTAQLADALDGPAPPKVLDVRLGEAFAMGHIPGAIHFSVYALNTYDTDPAPLRSFTHMWAFLLAQRGITTTDQIVVYGNISGMTAARAYWFIQYLGYGHVRLLDGGFTAWANSGRPVTQDATLPQAAACRYDVAPERVATYHDVLAAIDDPGCVILDTRSEKEWLGVDGRAARNGTVPSAVHQDWRVHLTDRGTMKSTDELAPLFTAVGCTPDKRVIAFCNTGYRSAHAYVALNLLGHPDVRNYVGSWQEWGNRDGCPVTVPKSG